MTVIDKRIVDLEFKHQQFASGVSSTVKSLDDLKKGLNFSNVPMGLDKLGANVQSIADRFSAWGIVGMTVIHNITNAIIGLGQKLIALTLTDPIKFGFEEFELKMGSIQTIMAGTGESLATVNRYLEDLNTYSDKTIYSFKDMTSNIGKFTNAGVKLPDAVAAIQGIANAAALSGANSNEASRAMYNFSQALSMGSVRIIDWRSIEQANMATLEFKNQLIATGVAVGTLTKGSDGLYRSLKGTEVNALNFRETLDDSWLSTKVLTTTLGKYADETTELGKRATAAAQDVKTFSQMVQTLKESLGSGWARTFEIVIGDFEEGKALFTEINGLLGGFFEKSSKARNDMLTAWKTMGGRSVLVASMKNSFIALEKVMTPIKDAFASIFPPITVDTLIKLSLALLNFTESLKLSETESANLKRTFAGIAAVIDLLLSGVTWLAKEFWKLFSAIAPSRDSILAFTGNIGDFLLSLRNGIKYQDLFGKTFAKIKDFLTPGSEALSKFIVSVKNFFEELKKSISNIMKDTGFEEFTTKLAGRLESLKGVVAGLGKVFSWFGDVLKALAPLGTAIWEKLKPMFVDLGERIKKGVSNLNYNNILDGLNTGLFAALVLIIKNFVSKSSGMKTASGIIKMLDSVRSSLETWQRSVKANTLLTIAFAVGILTLSIIALSLIDSTKLALALGSVSLLFTELVVAMTILEKIPSGKGLGKSAGSLIALAAAILILSVAVKMMSDLQPWELTNGLIGVGALLVGLGLFASFVKTNDIGLKSGIGLLLLAGSILILALAVQKFSEMDSTKLVIGLAEIGVLLAELGIFIALTSKTNNIAKTAIGLALIAGALYLLSVALEKIGAMDAFKIGEGLKVIGVTLAMLVVATRLLPKNLGVTAVALWVISKALGNLSKVVAEMGGLPLDVMYKGLATLGSVLIIIAGTMLVLSKGALGAAALMVVAGALWYLVPVLKILGGMSLGEIAASLGMLAGVFIIIGLAGLILGPIAPVLLVLATAIGFLGLGLLAVGVGMQAFAVGMAMLAVSGTAGALAMVSIVGILLSLIPMIVVAIVAGIVQFAILIAGSAAVLVGALVTVLTAMVVGIAGMIPIFAATMMLLVLKLLSVLVENAGKIALAGMDLIIALLKGIGDSIGKVVDAAFDIVINFLNALGKKIPEVVDAGWKMIISFVDGLTDGINNNLPKLIASGEKLAKAIIDGIVSSLLSGINTVGDTIKRVGDSALQGLKDILGIKSPSTKFAEIARYAMLGFTLGIEKYGVSAIESTTKFGEETVSGFTKIVSQIADAIDGNMDMNPSIRPVLDLSNITNGGKQINALLTPGQIDVSTTARRAAMISNGMGSTDPSQTNQVGDSIQFVQNNYSPTALSRYEIYRQTKNQLAALKGL